MQHSNINGFSLSPGSKSGLLSKVVRLVAVMEERKVFGTSGSKTLKELLAAAAVPAKKLSARTGASHAINGTHNPGQLQSQLPVYLATSAPHPYHWTKGVMV